MPIFEYKCRGCGQCFEAFVRPVSMSTVACPSCHGQDLEQLLSAFSVTTKERSKSAISAARRQNEISRRDERIAEREELAHHNEHDD